MISKKEVKHIAKLARLGLNEKETERYQKELSAILDYFQKLKEVDISEVKAETQPSKTTLTGLRPFCADRVGTVKVALLGKPIEIETAAREDKEKPKIQSSKKLLELAPETKNGYLKVKSIF